MQRGARVPLPRGAHTFSVRLSWTEEGEGGQPPARPWVLRYGGKRVFFDGIEEAWARTATSDRGVLLDPSSQRTEASFLLDLPAVEPGVEQMLFCLGRFGRGGVSPVQEAKISILSLEDVEVVGWTTPLSGATGGFCLGRLQRRQGSSTGSGPSPWVFVAMAEPIPARTPVEMGLRGAGVAG